MAFVHLHTHSEYSLLDGANRVPELVRHVQKLGMDSLAITDHGNMHCAWSFYEEARAKGLRPILGFEAYLAFGPRTVMQKPPSAPAQYSHLVLLARNRAGYKNLVRLSSIGYLEGFYRRPRIDKEVLAQYSEGIVCLAACLSGEIALYLRQGNYEAAKRSAEWFAQTFGPKNFWLEVQLHGIPEEQIVNAGMYRLGAELGLGVVATNDAHYLRREDAEAHDVLLAIGTGAELDDPKRFRFTGEESYVKSEPEMATLFRDHPETLANTQTVADGCEFSFEKKYFVPEFPRPEGFASEESLLESLATRRHRRPLRDPAPRPRTGAARVRTWRDQQGGLRRLLPDRSGLHQGGTRPGHPRRPGTRVGRRLDRRLRARHHQRRPAQVRSALRAVPESGAGVDAGHRHRLLLRAPRRGDRVCAAALRPRQRRADHHLRHAEGPRGGEGCGPPPAHPPR